MPNNKIKWPDEEYQLLDDGVRDLVKALHFLGIKTIFSCEGHIRTSPIYTGVLPWPYVILLISDDQIGYFRKELTSGMKLMTDLAGRCQKGESMDHLLLST